MDDNYLSKRKDYRLSLHNFLNHREADRVKKLCVAAEIDEKLFWKLLNRPKIFFPDDRIPCQGGFYNRFVKCGRNILKHWVTPLLI